MGANEPRVSDEDRRSAIAALQNAKCVLNGKPVGELLERPKWREAVEMVDALVSHGWGPKPRMSRREIERHIYHAALAAGSDLAATKVFDAIVSAAVGAVVVAGIEVSDD